MWLVALEPYATPAASDDFRSIVETRRRRLVTQSPVTQPAAPNSTDQPGYRCLMNSDNLYTMIWIEGLGMLVLGEERKKTLLRGVAERGRNGT
jgi:hypothetical protein